MKRIGTQKNSILKRVLINIPFVLIVAFSAAFFLAGAVLIFYCFVTAAAFKSAMISLILIGAGALCVGAGLGLVIAFKRYYAFYDKQMGWQYPDRKQKEEVTSVEGKKPLKAYFSLSNVALGFLFIGAVFTVISAALGCISRDKWVDAIGPYRESHGYLADVQKIEMSFYIADPSTYGYDLDKIDIDLTSKQAVIVFTNDEDKLGYVSVKAYFSYENQVTFALGDKKFSIKETPPPETQKTTVDKLLFFANNLWRSPSDKQVIVYLPEALKESVKINGEHIVAK